MTTDADDRALVERYRQGDVEALAALVEKYRRPLFSYILNMTERRHDADEVFQDVWLRVIRRLDSYHDRNLFGWLVRIAHNLVIDEYRRRKPIVSLDAGADEDAATPLDLLPASGPSPAAAAGAGELGRRIAAAVRTLPVEQREVFLMRVEGGVPFKDIAVIQKVSINTALARMQYALEKLRACLREHDGREPGGGHERR